VKVEIGDAVLYLGDCLEILPTLPKVDAVITDPPYGIALQLGMGGGYKGDGGMWAGVGISGDEDVSARDAALQLADAPFAAFASPRRAPPPEFRAVVVWDKGEHTGAGDLSMPWKPSFELVYVGGRGWSANHRGGGVIRFNAVAGCVADRNDGARFHPFEKPAALMAHFVERAPAGVICDPFMGSGTTGVACAQLGRKFIGIEIEPKYFDIACRRIEQAYAQGKLFQEPLPKQEQAALI
jgi:hypothetical protein